MEKQTKPKATAYLLSTCPRCRLVKMVLEEMGVECDKVMVDLLSRVERIKVMDLLRKERPIVSFPVIDVGDRRIYGATADEVRELFGGDQ